MNRVSRAVTLLSLSLMSACSSQDPPAAPAALATAVEAACSRFDEQEVGVAFRDLGTGRTWLRNGDLVMHAASTMKIAVMLEAYRQHESGRRDLDTEVPVRNRFLSIADGTPYALSADDDSEKDLYRHIGAALPMRTLVRRMMVRSSNLATNLVIELLGAEAVQATLDGTGCRRMRVLRGVEDTPAFEADMNNVTTARDLMILLEAVHDGRGVSAASRAEMLSILLAQEFNDMIPAGVPNGTSVAHKTGLITRIRHDAAIVFRRTQPPYILVVLTRGFDDKEAAGAVVREVSEAVWTHVTKETP